MQRRADTFRDHERPRLIRIRKNDTEFLAAETAGNINFTDLSTDDTRYFAQDHVSCQMPVLVVDFLEMIHVDHKKGERQFLQFRAAEFFLKAFIEVSARMHARKPIGDRHILDIVIKTDAAQRECELVREDGECFFILIT